MAKANLSKTFTAAAEAVGARVLAFDTIDPALEFIAAQAAGTIVVPDFPSGERMQLAGRLRGLGLELAGSGRTAAEAAAAGVTGANFALAATGTVVLESTAEEVRLATTLPERHFVLLDPAKIIADDFAAVPHLRELHRRQPRNYLAYITGPSRTADIERVLTIGVHGPRELHILLVPGLSSDVLEL
ncbi:lactate utilization protein [Desulfuromonas carbonis]|uniref:lactate utilization protein n=1 Tax=Desulfuromonas sp. DDH964 TaxID=1823759 RepID=UPI00078E0A45|nr:lactate utilization protein [Desulfuromonas sp. DDH964]AMV73822.1 hypothetical protein DBW_3524 [Desulfuromonas sp. DDH964]